MFETVAFFGHQTTIDQGSRPDFTQQNRLSSYATGKGTLAFFRYQLYLHDAITPHSEAGLLSFPCRGSEVASALEVHRIPMQGDCHVANLSGPQAIQRHGPQASEYAGLVPRAAMIFTQRHVSNMMILILHAPVTANGALECQCLQHGCTDPP